MAGDALVNFTTQSGGTLSLVYDYTPATVPEPASMVLLGAAAMAGAVRRLRRR
jgi:hypothetical protein